MGWWKNPYEDRDVEDHPFFCRNCGEERTGHGYIGQGSAALTCNTCGTEDDDVWIERD